MPIIHRENGIPPAKSKMVNLKVADSDVVAAGANKKITLTPPIGFLWRIKSLRLKAFAPTGAGAGLHRFDIFNTTGVLISGESVFGSIIEWDSSKWIVADSVQKPTSEIAALYALQTAIHNSDNPIEVTYYNDTDVGSPAPGIRTINIAVEETPII